MHACIHADHVQVDEKPAKSRKKPACDPKSQPKVKKPALKQSEKAPSSKRQKTSKKDDSKSTRRSKASKRPAQSPQEDAPVKKPKAAGAKAAAVKSKPKAKATPPSEEPETVPDGGKVTRVRKPPVSAEPVEAVTKVDVGKKQEPAVAASETQAPGCWLQLSHLQGKNLLSPLSPSVPKNLLWLLLQMSRWKGKNLLSPSMQGKNLLSPCCAQEPAWWLLSPIAMVAVSTFMICTQSHVVRFDAMVKDVCLTIGCICHLRNVLQVQCVHHSELEGKSGLKLNTMQVLQHVAASAWASECAVSSKAAEGGSIHCQRPQLCRSLVASSADPYHPT